MKPTHDFLSLSSFQRNDARSAQAYPAYPMTHDFLQPLERVGKSHGAKGAETAEKPAVKEHVLPGGIGTYSIGHVAPEFSRGIGGRKPAEAIVPAIGPEEKAESDDNKAGLVHGSGSFIGSGAGFYGGGAFTLWQETVVAGDKRAERQPWIGNSLNSK